MSVTARQVYIYALALMDALNENGQPNESADAAYGAAAPAVIDMIQRDLTLGEGAAVSKVSSLGDVLTVSDDTALRVMPWGLAAQFALSDNDSKYSEFRSEYTRRAVKAAESGITDETGVLKGLAAMQCGL